LFRTGEDAFMDATMNAAKGRVPTAGITIDCSFLRIDPLTGELIDAIEEVVDETEVDKRALLRFLDSTSEPPKVNMTHTHTQYDTRTIFIIYCCCVNI
jgi:hypothetical protein